MLSKVDAGLLLLELDDSRLKGLSRGKSEMTSSAGAVPTLLLGDHMPAKGRTGAGENLSSRFCCLHHRSPTVNTCG